MCSINEEREKIDFSSLDPALDEDRWERRIRGIVRTALATREAKVTVWSQLTAWAKPALAAAVVTACICVTVAAVSSVEDTRDKTSVSVQTEPALALAEWAASDEPPATSLILEILGGYNDKK
jgi:negative regulator of sigma E activity